MRTAILLLFVALSAAAPLAAQDSAGPVTRTARLAWFRGDLQVQRADNTAPDGASPDSAALNMPIPEGSRLVTGDGAEAEIEFEDGSVARLTPKSALSVDSLGFDGKTATTQLSLLGGLAYFELRHAPGAAYTVSAGGVLAMPAENAVFRVELDQPPAVVSVLSGTLTVTASGDPDDATKSGFSATVKAGESLHADSGDPARYFLNSQVVDNAWDAWNQSRDNAANSDAATRTSARDDYASAQGYGWSDLDASGTWYTVTNPDGSTSELWQPSIAANPDASVVDAADSTGDPDPDAFDPYGDGAFVYSGGAYVWASGFSWGWLPYRCGRWNYFPQFGWAWTPNRFCRIYGYGGFGGINIGRHPRRYRAIEFPRPTPVHPIIRIHTSTPHPKSPDRPAPVKLASITATPLQPLPAPAMPAAGFTGGALYRDYPIESATRQPILGSFASPVTEPSAVSGWVAPPPALESPRIVRAPGGTSYIRPAVPVRAQAPAAAAPKPAPAPAPAPAAASKPK